MALLKWFRIYLKGRFGKLCNECAITLRIYDFGQPLYSRGSFNECGDFVAHLGLHQHFDLSTKEKDQPLNEKAFSIREDFSRYAASKKARVVVVWPSIPEPVYIDRKGGIQRVASKMAEYPGILVKGTPSDYLLSVDNFFDTIYHLNREGRCKQTIKILNYLSGGLRCNELVAELVAS